MKAAVFYGKHNLKVEDINMLKQMGFKNAYYYKNRCAVEYEI